jgi:hypothetical protein
MGMTLEQKEKLRQMRKELSQQAEQEFQKRADQFLALLNPQQREKLRIEAEQKYRTAHDPAETRKLNILSFRVSTTEDNEAGGDSKTDSMVLPVYEKLGQAAVRKRLGLSANQEKQLRDIATKCQAEKKKLTQETAKLPPEERRRKWPQLEQESLQIINQAREQIEALLTPEQLAALKDIVFRSWAIGSLNDAHFREELQLNDEQKTALNRFGREASELGGRLERERMTKELGVLTPEQQEKLHEELDRRGW